MATCASSATSMPRVATRVRARIGGGGATGRVALRPRARAAPRAAPVTTTTTPHPFVDFDTTGCGPFPLLDPTRGYTHVSPGVCDTCAAPRRRDARGSSCCWASSRPIAPTPSAPPNSSATNAHPTTPRGTERGRATTRRTSRRFPKTACPKAKAPPCWTWWTRRSGSYAGEAWTTCSRASRLAKTQSRRVLFHSIASEIDKHLVPERSNDRHTRHRRRCERKGGDDPRRDRVLPGR